MIYIGDWWDAREPCTPEEFEKSIQDIGASGTSQELLIPKDRMWHDAFGFIVPKVQHLYDYAFNGLQLSPGDTPIDAWLIDAFHDLVTVVGLHSLLRELTCDDYGDEVPPQMVLLAGMARFKIDSYLGTSSLAYDDIASFGMIPQYCDPEFLSIKEIALLANMAERSVENYRTQSQGGILTMQKQVIRYGEFRATKKVVAVGDAYQFLRGRRGYTASQSADKAVINSIMR